MINNKLQPSQETGPNSLHYLNNIPASLAELPHWCSHNEKRPILPPDQFHNGQPLRTLISSGQTEVGLLLAPAPTHDYLIIDIDYPKSDEEKEAFSKELRQLANNDPGFLGSQAHLEKIYETTRSIIKTELFDLISQTYTEFSWSLTGLRMVISSKDKAKYKRAYKKAKSFKGQIDFKNQFMTFTGIMHPNSTQEIAEVPLLSLDKAFGFSQTSASDTNNTQQSDEVADIFSDIDGLPSQEDIIRALAKLPIDQNERVKQVYKEITGEEYEHYFFWLYVGMAIHDFGKHFTKTAKLYRAFLLWSQEDKVAYKDEEDVEATWNSFGGASRHQDSKITWKTLVKMANRCTFDYPRPVINKNTKKSTGCPMVNEYVNFQYLLDFYEIKLYEDDGFYITGDKHICDQYFLNHGARIWFNKFYGPLSKDGLIASTLKLCQDSKWRGLSNTTTLVSTWLAQPRCDMDLFQLWMDTPFEELPKDMQQIDTRQGRFDARKFDDNSTLDFIIECLNIQHPKKSKEYAVSKAMVRATFMQMIKFRENLHIPFTDNGGMLIFIGAENTYKSTFFKLLLPKQLDFMRKEVNMKVGGDKGVRDFLRYLGKKTIVQVDEFEGLMDYNKNSSLLKAIISGDTASLTDIYQTSDTVMRRKAILVGTSNETRHILSENGSRRMWFVKVGKIDTNALLQINLHTLYNRLRDEFRAAYNNGEMPWLLSQSQINTLYQMNDLLSAKSDIALALNDTWPQDDGMPKGYLDKIKSVQTDKTGILYTTKEVMHQLQLSGVTLPNMKLSNLERALERFCGKYTDTLGVTKQLINPRAILVNGRLCQGILLSGKFKYAKWVMPPLADNLKN